MKKNYSKFISYFARRKFGTEMPILSTLSYLPPVDRCNILSILIELNPNNIHLYDKLSLALLKNKDYSAALHILNRGEDIGVFERDECSHLKSKLQLLYQEKKENYGSSSNYQQALLLLEKERPTLKNLGIEELCREFNAVMTDFCNYQLEEHYVDSMVGAQWLIDAGKFFKQGDFEKSLQYYTNSIQNLSDDIDIMEDAYEGRGMCSLKLNSFDNAIYDFCNTIRLNKNKLLSYAYRGECHFKKGQYKNAIYDFEKSLTLDFNEWEEQAAWDAEEREEVIHDQVKFETYLNLAEAYDKIEDDNNCLRNLELAFAINPNDAIETSINLIKENIKNNNETVN